MDGLIFISILNALFTSTMHFRMTSLIVANTYKHEIITFYGVLLLLRNNLIISNLAIYNLIFTIS